MLIGKQDGTEQRARALDGLLFHQLLLQLACLGVQLGQLAEVIVGEGNGVLDAGECRVVESTGLWVPAGIQHATHGPELAGDVTVGAHVRRWNSKVAPGAP